MKQLLSPVVSAIVKHVPVFCFTDTICQVPSGYNISNVRNIYYLVLTSFPMYTCVRKSIIDVSIQ